MVILRETSTKIQLSGNLVVSLLNFLSHKIYLQWLFFRRFLETANSKLTICCCLFHVIFSIFKIAHSIIMHNLDFLFDHKSLLCPTKSIVTF